MANNIFRDNNNSPYPRELQKDASRQHAYNITI